MKGQGNPKLPKAPLQEVIFELLWEIDFTELGNPIDLGFELAQGVFAKKVIDDFPYKKRTIPEGIAINIYPKTIHQFWKKENVWPVVQLGPGIMALNDTEHNYEWHSGFYPLIEKQTINLEESYDRPLVYKGVSLRYIDAVEISQSDRSDLLKYINSKFRFSIENSFELPGLLSHVQMSQSYEIDEHTQLSLLMNDGVNKYKKPAIIWQIHVHSNSRMNREKVLSWVENAHTLTSNLFKNILNSEFYDSFK